jgi:hypothetical protein
MVTVAACSPCLVYAGRANDVNRYSKSLGDKAPGGVLALMRFEPTSARLSFLTPAIPMCSAVDGSHRKTGRFHVETIWSPLGMEFDAFYTLGSRAGRR